MEKKMLHRDLDQHLKNMCPYRQYQCPHCKDTGRYCDITTIHLYMCPMVKTPCPNNGCKASVLCCNLSDHLTMCGYTLLRCTNKCMKGKKILRRDLDRHLKNKCPNRQYQCPHCKATGRYCDITTTHLDTCPKVEIPCPNSDCKASVLRCNLSDHCTTCGYTLLRCTNKCMEGKKEVKLLRRDLDHHLKNKCPNRQYECPHCKATGRYCDITTTHLDTCPKVNTPCPDSECKVSVFRCNLSYHKSKCQYEMVPCKYADRFGCKEKPLRRDLEQHENDDTFHFSLVMQTVDELLKKMKRQQEEIGEQKEKINKQKEEIGELKKEINKQKEEIGELKKEINKQKEEIGELKEEINKQKEEIGELKEEINKQKEEIGEQKKEMNEQREEIKTVKEEQKVMSDGIIAAQAGSCVFKVPKFNQHKLSKQHWYSPQFYSHIGGYKMCVRVDASGNGADTHVSVFAYLMKGRNDDNLLWPFTGKVTITLLNQLADKNHHTDTISLPQDNDFSRRVVVGERAPRGYGFPKFISHDQLHHDAAKNCQYLKDDCIYFKIEAQATKPTKPWLTCTV